MLGRSCEPAYLAKFLVSRRSAGRRRSACRSRPATLRAGRRLVRGEVLGLVGVDPDDDPGLTPGLLERVADVARATNSGSRIVRPSPESGPAPATCLPGCALAFRLPDSTLGATSRHRGRPPIPLIECCRVHLGPHARLANTALGHSERCCGIPASSARTSVSR